MTMRRQLCFAVAVVLLATAVRQRDATAAPGCKAHVVPRLSGEPYARYKAWIEKQPDEGPQWGGFVYAVDLDNDGQQEIVETRYEGSGGYLNLLIYRQVDGGGYRPLGDVPAPAGATGDGSWYSHDGGDLTTGERTPFIELCGLTYLVLSDGPDGARQGYLWKDGKTVRACDAAWTGLQTGDFQALYDHKSYDLAKNNLEDYLAACGAKLDSGARLRMLSDLTITSYHLSDYRQCLDDVARARKEPGFATSKLRRALEYNAGLCAAPPRPKVERSWFAFDKGVLKDVNLELVLANTVPAFDFDWAQPDERLRSWIAAGVWPGRGVAHDHERYDLRGMIRDRIGPPGDGNLVTHDRYVSMWGCMPHSCEDRAFIWADVETGTSGFAINEFQAPGVKAECFAIGSRTLGLEALPAAFLSAYEEWKAHQQPLRHACTYFIDGRAADVKVTVIEANGAPSGTRR